MPEGSRAAKGTGARVLHQLGIVFGAMQLRQPGAGPCIERLSGLAEGLNRLEPATLRALQQDLDRLIDALRAETRKAAAQLPEDLNR